MSTFLRASPLGMLTLTFGGTVAPGIEESAPQSQKGMRKSCAALRYWERYLCGYSAASLVACLTSSCWRLSQHAAPFSRLQRMEWDGARSTPQTASCTDDAKTRKAVP